MSSEILDKTPNVLNMLLLRGAVEGNLLVLFGPSYVITRLVIGMLAAAASVLLARFSLYGA